jgi:hypothetical protein
MSTVCRLQHPVVTVPITGTPPLRASRCGYVASGVDHLASFRTVGRPTLGTHSGTIVTPTAAAWIGSAPRRDP